MVELWGMGQSYAEVESNFASRRDSLVSSVRGGGCTCGPCRLAATFPVTPYHLSQLSSTVHTYLAYVVRYCDVTEPRSSPPFMQALGSDGCCVGYWSTHSQNKYFGPEVKFRFRMEGFNKKCTLKRQAEIIKV